MSPKPAIDPVRRTVPPPPPRAAETTGADPFPPARTLALGAEAPEDVVVDSEGRLLTGVEGGAILRLDPAGGEVETVGNTGGRPLGLEPLPDGRLLICDSHKGLLRLDPESGRHESLVRQVDGLPLRFCSNATVAADGTIWFTESSARFGYEDYRAAIIEQRGTGRLFRLDTNGEVEVVARGLQFPNGVTMSSDESAVFFVETNGYRLCRVDVGGQRAGQVQVVNGDLPGIPDNMSRSVDGRFWVAMVAPRNPALEWLAPRSPILRRLIWLLPEALSLKPARTVWVMCFDEKGRTVADIQDDREEYTFVTGVAEHAGRLYLSSLQEQSLLELDLTGAAFSTP